MAFNFNLVDDENQPYDGSGFQAQTIPDYGMAFQGSNPMMPANPIKEDKGHPMYSLDTDSKGSTSLSAVKAPSYEDSIKQSYGIKPSNTEILLKQIVTPLISNGLAYAVGGRRGLHQWLESKAPQDELAAKQDFERNQKYINDPTNKEAYSTALNKYYFDPNVNFQDLLNKELGLNQKLTSLGTGEIGTRTKAGVYSGHPLADAAQSALDAMNKPDSKSELGTWMAQHPDGKIEQYWATKSALDAGKRINMAEHLAPIDVNKAVAIDYNKNEKWLGGTDLDYTDPDTGQTYHLEHFDPALDTTPGEPTFLQKALPSVFGAPNNKPDHIKNAERIKAAREARGQNVVQPALSSDKKKKKTVKNVSSKAIPKDDE